MVTALATPKKRWFTFNFQKRYKDAFLVCYLNPLRKCETTVCKQKKFGLQIFGLFTQVWQLFFCLLYTPVRSPNKIPKKVFYIDFQPLFVLVFDNFSKFKVFSTKLSFCFFIQICGENGYQSVALTFFLI